jgi:hypothetical protein
MSEALKKLILHGNVVEYTCITTLTSAGSLNEGVDKWTSVRDSSKSFELVYRYDERRMLEHIKGIGEGREVLGLELDEGDELIVVEIRSGELRKPLVAIKRGMYMIDRQLLEYMGLVSSELCVKRGKAETKVRFASIYGEARVNTMTMGLAVDWHKLDGTTIHVGNTVKIELQELSVNLLNIKGAVLSRAFEIKYESEKGRKNFRTISVLETISEILGSMHHSTVPGVKDLYYEDDLHREVRNVLNLYPGKLAMRRRRVLEHGPREFSTLGVWT